MANLTERITTLEKHRKDLLASLQGFSHEELNRKPNETSWSAIQNLHHLIMAERGALAYLEKKTQHTAKVKKTGFNNNLRYFALQAFFYIPFLKIKAPKVVADVPTQPISLVETIKEWDEVRIKLIALCNSLSTNELDKELFKHPLAGKLNIYQMLGFLDEHLMRHAAQALRAVK